MAASNPTDSSGQTPTPRTRQPNYAARRMLVSTIAITVLVAGSVVAWRAISGGSSSSPGAAGDWTEIALVDPASGDVTIVDEDGEAVDTTPPLGRTTEVETLGDRATLIGPTSLTLTDLTDTAPIVIPVERGAVVSRLPVDGQLVFAVGSPQGGNVLIVDALTEETYDIGAIAGQDEPLMFVETLRHDDDASSFAVADAAAFQTIVVRRDVPEPGYFRDVPLAVDDVVATSQVVGQRSEIGLYDMEGSNLTLTPTEIPAGGVLDGETLTFVSIDGGVFRLDGDAESPERLGGVTPPVGSTIDRVRPSLDGERLVLDGDVFQAVVNADGSTVFTTTFAAPIEPLEAQPGWQCLPVGSVSAGHSIISLDTGEQLADLTGLTIDGTASDGCSVLGSRGGPTELVTADGRVTLGRLRSATLGPDGRSVVVQTTTGNTELWTYDDDLERRDPVDLSDHAGPTTLVAFLDR